MKKYTNKGFTIVELVIVVAVIAILAAVLIPTFASLIKKEYRDDKAVKTAISGIHNAEFKLIDLEGEETVLGEKREEGEADAEAAAAARDKIDNYSLDANTVKKAD